MAETICPRCGFSPIPSGAQLCPKCRRPFYVVERSYENTNVTATRAGGLTGSVTASPGAIVAALVVGAAFWVVRSAGLFGTPVEPQWAYAVAGAQVLAAMLLLTTSGPAKQAPVLAGLIEAGAAYALGGPWPLLVLCVAHGLGLILGTLFEPGRARLMAGGTFATVSALAALAALPLGAKSEAHPAIVLHDGLVGFTLTLPPKWKEASRSDLGVELTIPLRTERSAGIAFKQPVTQLLGVLWVSRNAPGADGCQKALSGMKLSALTEVLARAPSAFGAGAQVFEVKTNNGAGRAVCSKNSGDSLIAMSVIAVSGDSAAAAQALEDVAAGLVP